MPLTKNKILKNKKIYKSIKIDKARTKNAKKKNEKTKIKLSFLMTKQLKKTTLPIYKKTHKGAFFIKIKATYLVIISNSLRKITKRAFGNAVAPVFSKN